MLWLAAAVLVAMTSCSKNEETNPEANTGKAIGFKTFVNQVTKGTPMGGTTYTTGSFGVLAYYTTADNWATNAATATPNFMYNQKVDVTSGAGTYAPAKYWPAGENDKVSFFAYSPYAAAGGAITLPANSATGAPVLTYTVPATVADQADLMTAQAVNKTSADGTVKFVFSHALTQVKFSAKIDAALPDATTVNIKSLQFDGLQMTGTVALADGTVTATGAANGTFTWDALATTFTGAAATTAQELTEAGNVMMLLPQTLGTTQKVTLSYEVVVTDAAVAGGKVTTPCTKEITLPGSPAWASGKVINYVLTLGVDASKVDISAEIGTDWDATGGNTPVND